MPHSEYSSLLPFHAHPEWNISDSAIFSFSTFSSDINLTLSQFLFSYMETPEYHILTHNHEISADVVECDLPLEILRIVISMGDKLTYP